MAARLRRFAGATMALAAVAGASAAGPPAGARLNTVLFVTCGSSRQCLAVGDVDHTAGAATGYALASADGGLRWAPVGVPPVAPLGLACWSARSCMADGLAGRHGDGRGVGRGGKVAVTSDGGRRWSTTTLAITPGSGGSLSCPAPGRCVVVGHVTPTAGDAGGVDVPAVALTTDGGRSFAIHPLAGGRSGLALAAVSCAAAKVCVAVGTTSGPVVAGVAYGTIDGGTVWVPLPVPPLPGLLGVSCAGTACVAIAAPSEVAVSSDGGARWSAVTVPLPSSLSQLNQVSCAADGTCVVAAASQELAVSTDGGEAWRVAVLPRAANGESVWCGPAACLAGGLLPGVPAAAGFVARAPGPDRPWSLVWSSR